MLDTVDYMTVLWACTEVSSANASEAYWIFELLKSQNSIPIEGAYIKNLLVFSYSSSISYKFCCSLFLHQQVMLSLCVYMCVCQCL